MGYSNDADNEERRYGRLSYRDAVRLGRVRDDSETKKEKTKRPRRAEAPERPRLRIRNPQHDKPEPADATFTYLLQEVRLAKQIREHWQHDDSIVRGAHRVEREKWRHLARVCSPEEDA